MLDTFQPLLEAAEGLELSDPDTARAQLAQRFPPDGADAGTLNAALKNLFDAGQIAENGELPVRWGRVTKATPESRDFSIDVVVMNGAGPRHRHPQGEVNYCVALEGEPRFEDQPPGWVVLAPETTHVPAVTGGKMLIVYLLPKGEIEFLKG